MKTQTEHTEPKRFKNFMNQLKAEAKGKVFKKTSKTRQGLALSVPELIGKHLTGNPLPTMSLSPFLETAFSLEHKDFTEIAKFQRENEERIIALQENLTAINKERKRREAEKVELWNKFIEANKSDDKS